MGCEGHSAGLVAVGTALPSHPSLLFHGSMIQTLSREGRINTSSFPTTEKLIADLKLTSLMEYPKDRVHIPQYLYYFSLIMIFVL